VDSIPAQKTGDRTYKVEDANHMDVCKPPSKEHPSYKFLVQYIITCGKVSLNELVRCASPQVKNIPVMGSFDNLSLLVKW
jgi:hypothetical protein